MHSRVSSCLPAPVESGRTRVLSPFVGGDSSAGLTLELVHHPTSVHSISSPRPLGGRMCPTTVNAVCQGHRWFDLDGTSRISLAMGTTKNTMYAGTSELLDATMLDECSFPFICSPLEASPVQRRIHATKMVRRRRKEAKKNDTKDFLYIEVQECSSQFACSAQENGGCSGWWFMRYALMRASPPLLAPHTHPSPVALLCRWIPAFLDVERAHDSYFSVCSMCSVHRSAGRPSKAPPSPSFAIDFVHPSPVPVILATAWCFCFGGELAKSVGCPRIGPRGASWFLHSSHGPPLSVASSLLFIARQGI